MSAAEVLLIIAAGILGGLVGGVLCAWAMSRLAAGTQIELDRRQRLLNTTILIRRKGERLLGPMRLEDLALAIKYGGDTDTDILMGMDGWSMFGVYDLVNRTAEWEGWPKP